MTKEFTYDINQFMWVKEINTFVADAWDLVAWMEDGLTHPEAFPNMKRQFYIKNYKTGNQRRFRFVKEYIDSPDNEPWSETYWQFKSEDGIICSICVALN